MNAKHNVKSGVEQQINSIQMSEHQRDAALHAASVAELLIDAIVWVCKQAGRLGAAGFAKPSPKF